MAVHSSLPGTLCLRPLCKGPVDCPPYPNNQKPPKTVLFVPQLLSDLHLWYQTFYNFSDYVLKLLYHICYILY